MPEVRVHARVPAGHPSLAGHFPGNPVVPGVLLLDLVLGALRTEHGPQWQLRRIPAVKFLLPLRPDEPFEIVLCLSGVRLDWRCESNGKTLAQGSWELEGEATPAAGGAG